MFGMFRVRTICFFWTYSRPTLRTVAVHSEHMRQGQGRVGSGRKVSGQRVRALASCCSWLHSAICGLAQDAANLTVRRVKEKSIAALPR